MHRKYPWKKWLFSKTPLYLYQGKHFDLNLEMMKQQIRNAAVRYKRKVSIQTIPSHRGTGVKVTTRSK